MALCSVGVGTLGVGGWLEVYWFVLIVVDDSGVGARGVLARIRFIESRLVLAVVLLLDLLVLSRRLALFFWSRRFWGLSAIRVVV